MDISFSFAKRHQVLLDPVAPTVFYTHRKARGSLLFMMKFRLSVLASAIIEGMNVAGLRNARNRCV